MNIREYSVNAPPFTPYEENYTSLTTPIPLNPNNYEFLERKLKETTINNNNNNNNNINISGGVNNSNISGGSSGTTHGMLLRSLTEPRLNTGSPMLPSPLQQQQQAQVQVQAQLTLQQQQQLQLQQLQLQQQQQAQAQAQQQQQQLPPLSTSPPLPPGSGSPIMKRTEATFVMDISPSVVGWIIGRSGIRIKEIQAQTGCKMWVDQDVPNDQPRKIYFHGSKINIDAAVNRVSELVQAAPILASASVTLGKGLTSTIVDCPVSLVGLLIGKRGWTIKKIQQASGAQISINQSVREGLPRKIIVSGDENSVSTALHLIDEVLRDKSGGQDIDRAMASSPGANGMYLNGIDIYGRLDGSPIYDPRLQNPGINSLYRQQQQQYQNLSGTSPSSTLLPGSAGTTQSISGGRFPSPDNRTRGMDMFTPGSYDGIQQAQQQQQQQQQQQLDSQQLSSSTSSNSSSYININNSIDNNISLNSAMIGMDPNSPSYVYPRQLNQAYQIYPDDNINPNLSPQSNLMIDEFNNNNNININNNLGIGVDNSNIALNNRSSREDSSLLSFHLRQQHQKSYQQQQQQQNMQQQQGHVYPLTQSKMSYRPVMASSIPANININSNSTSNNSPNIHNISGISSNSSSGNNNNNNNSVGTQPIFIPNDYSLQHGVASSPIDSVPNRTLSESSGVYTRFGSSQSNSYQSSPISESPLNGGPYMPGSSPTDSNRSIFHSTTYTSTLPSTASISSGNRVQNNSLSGSMNSNSSNSNSFILNDPTDQFIYGTNDMNLSQFNNNNNMIINNNNNNNNNNNGIIPITNDGNNSLLLSGAGSLGGVGSGSYKSRSRLSSSSSSDGYLEQLGNNSRTVSYPNQNSNINNINNSHNNNLVNGTQYDGSEINSSSLLMDLPYPPSSRSLSNYDNQTFYSNELSDQLRQQQQQHQQQFQQHQQQQQQQQLYQQQGSQSGYVSQMIPVNDNNNYSPTSLYSPIYQSAPKQSPSSAASSATSSSSFLFSDPSPSTSSLSITGAGSLSSPKGVGIAGAGAGAGGGVLSGSFNWDDTHRIPSSDRTEGVLNLSLLQPIQETLESLVLGGGGGVGAASGANSATGVGGSDYPNIMDAAHYSMPY